MFLYFIILNKKLVYNDLVWRRLATMLYEGSLSLSQSQSRGMEWAEQKSRGTGRGLEFTGDEKDKFYFFVMTKQEIRGYFFGRERSMCRNNYGRFIRCARGNSLNCGQIASKEGH